MLVVDGLGHADVGIFLNTGMIKVYPLLIAPISSNVFLNVVPSFCAAKIFCIYWCQNTPSVFSTSNFWKYSVFCPFET